MTDTTITTQAPIWDATTPEGYAMFFIVCMFAAVLHATIGGGQ